MWVYGGYRYGNDDEEGSGFTSYDLIRRHIDTNEWKEVPIVELSWLPRARHSHSAAVYNVRLDSVLFDIILCSFN